MNRLVYIALILFFCFFEDCLAQTTTQKTIERAMKHIKDAEKHYVNMEYTKAKESYQFAARLFRNNNLPAYYAICYNGIGNIYIDLSLYNEAKNKGFDKSIQQLSEIKSIDPNFKIDSSLIADAYEGLGRYYSSVSTSLTTKKGKETKVHYDVALDYHQKALALRLKLYGKQHAKVAQSYYFIGQCYRGFTVNAPHQATDFNPIQMELDFLLRALNMQQQTVGEEHHQSANSYEALGNFHYEIKKDYHKGFDYHKKALKIRQNRFDVNHPQIASSFNNLAIYYRIMNVFDEELNYLEKALKIQLSILGTEHEEIGKSYYLLANRYRRAGEVNKALSYYGYALDIFRKVKNETSVEVAETYLAIALCYRDLDQTKLEHQYLRLSENIHQKSLGKKHFKIALVYAEIGAYYGHQEIYDSSLYYYNNAININKTQLGEKHYAVAEAYDKIAAVYRRKGNKAYELDFLLQSLALKQDETYQKTTVSTDLGSSLSQLESAETIAQQLYKSYIHLAEFHERGQDYTLALNYIHRALAAVCPSLDGVEIDLYTNPSTNELSRNIQWLEALEAKGLLFMKLYNLNHKDKDLEFAIKTYYQAIDVIHSLRTNFTSNSSRKQLTQLSMPVYEGAISALYVLYNNTQDQRYLNQAFEIVEQSKSFVLLQALQNTHARGSSNIPVILLEREKELRRSLAYYSNHKNKGDKNDQKFDKVYYQLKSSYDSLITTLEVTYPTYYNLKYKTSVQSSTSVEQHILDDNTLLLEYFVGDHSLYVFKLTKKSKAFFQIPIPNEYQTLVNDLRSTLTNYDMITKHPKWAYNSFVLASYNFYTQLLEPFLKDISSEINKLTIVPDGLLNHIPFEVLISSKPTDPSKQQITYQDLPFLIKRFQINYSYSSTLLISNILNTNQQNNSQCLAFAPATQHSSDSLPWTQKELKAIERIYDGEYFLDDAANKETFKTLASDFSIVHLAMHGYVNMRAPMRSYLSFANDLDSSNTEESKLFAYEIHNLPLNADLVVLSACHTGFGKAVRGEGVLSLAHAFLYAGAPSVVTTLWEVNDFTSAALVEVFYSNLSKGMSKPLALQQAKLTFLSKTDHLSGHPTYWGSFITIGSPRPLAVKTNYWLWLLLGISILGLFYLLFRKFFSSKSIAPKKDKKVAVLSLEQLLEQEDLLQNKLSMDEENPVLFYELGLFQFEQLKKHKKASYSFEEAIELNPQFADAYLGLAKCKKELGQLQVAQKAYKKAYELQIALKTSVNDRYFEVVS